MNKLEEDYTYLQLQAELSSLRYHREKTNTRIDAIMRHINAIQRDFKEYEEEYMKTMIKTNDIMSESELRAFYNMMREDDIEDMIQTHDGDWIKEVREDAGYPISPVYQWRFWKHEGVDSETERSH